MFLAKVIGTLVATTKHEALTGVKLLIVQPVNEQLQPNAEPVVAVDGTHMAGPGEIVYCIASREGSLVLENWFTPVDHGILGIVDEIVVVVDRREVQTLSHGRPTTPDKEQPC
ncbi:MAG: EutN/CcmL family microcompartment protein [Bradymonadales bacterium]|nr:EutN/CcmL family microcompartment protein [Bradymonadales bacterium]